MFLAGKMIIYINCSDKQFSTVKKKKVQKECSSLKKSLVFIQKTAVSHLKNIIGRGIVEAVYSDHDPGFKGYPHVSLSCLV